MDPNNSNGHDSTRPAAFLSPTVDHGNHLHFLDLALSSFPYCSLPLPPPPTPTPTPTPIYTLTPVPASELGEANQRPRQPRRKTSKNSASARVKSELLAPPYPWATNKRAIVYSLHDLLSRDIRKIRGSVQCRKCDQLCEIEFDLEAKFAEVSTYLVQNMDNFRHRAPQHWQYPKLPRCGKCLNDDSLKPLISPKKRSINWLFLFLGQMLGCCTLEQLKYFCKHTRNHRTGAKNRVLFLTYLGMCKQLKPTGPFHL